MKIGVTMTNIKTDYLKEGYEIALNIKNKEPLSTIELCFVPIVPCAGKGREGSAKEP